MAGLAPALYGIGGAAAKPLGAPKPPRSIIAQALAGHPNWRGGSLPQAGNPGSALLGAGVLTQGPTKPQAAGAPAAAPAGGSGGSSGSPFDAAYYQNVAQNQFAVNNHINALNLQQSQDQTALQTALAQLAYQQPRDQLALEQRANAGGGLYSSVENMNQANLVHSYATRQTADQSNYNNAAAKIAAQIAALQQGIPIYNAGQAAAAGDRAAQAALNNPALTAPPAASAPAAAAPAATSGGGKPAPRTQRSIIAQAIAGHPNWSGRRR